MQRFKIEKRLKKEGGREDTETIYGCKKKRKEEEKDRETETETERREVPVGRSLDRRPHVTTHRYPLAHHSLLPPFPLCPPRLPSPPLHTSPPPLLLLSSPLLSFPLLFSPSPLLFRSQCFALSRAF